MIIFDYMGKKKGGGYRAIIILGAFFFLLPFNVGAESLFANRLDAFFNKDISLYQRVPRFHFSLQTHYVFMDGKARARETAQEKFYPSSGMKDLNVADNMGISDMVLYGLGMDFSLIGRNHVRLRYLWGQAEGEGRTGHRTGFNDSHYYEPGETEGYIKLDSLQLEWYYRAVSFDDTDGRYALDLGVGAMNLRSEISFTDDGEEIFETEVIHAPLMAYVVGHGEWRPKERFTVGLNLQGSVYSVDSSQLIELPAEGRYYRAELYGNYELNEYMCLAAGVNYWNFMVAFKGVETNDRDHHADNKLAVWMAGASVGLDFKSPTSLGSW